MRNPLRIVWIFLFISFLDGQAGYGQVSTPTTVPPCGIADLPPAQALDLIKQGKQAYQQKINSGAAFQSITYVPIRPHIVRRSDGTGGLDMAGLNQQMAYTNSHYLLNNLGIQFYFAGTTPDYIDNDAYYAVFPYPETEAANGRDATNALNQYYIYRSARNASGYAYYPFDDVTSTRSIIATGDGSQPYINGNYTIPHELGHNFNLIHTFGSGDGTTLTNELVTRGAGANCTTAGDLICDTPADPYTSNSTGYSVLYDGHCEYYDPNSTVRDANGDPFSPALFNIMSYYGTRCQRDFTPGQFDRIQEGLALRQSHTAYTLNAPPTNVTPPSNLTAMTNGIGVSVTLNWQDNANNEMGYFIERSTSSGTGFLPIGGVGPNATTFTDASVTLNTTYYYRIKPSNSTTGNLSSVLAFRPTYPAVTGLTTTSISGSSAELDWTSAGNNLSYTVQYRAAGSADWNTITLIQGNSYTLYSLNINTAYEWQVKISGAETYSGPVSFTTTCPTPVPYATSPSRTSASLNWSYFYPETYTLQYRQQNTPTWNTIDASTSTYYSLTGLAPATPYEWQVRGTCSTTLLTGYSPVQSFTTLACPVPSLLLSSYTSSALSLYWNTAFYEPNRSYTLRYRPTSTTNWTTVGGLASTNYQLTGLTVNTTYEVQVQSVCSPTDLSGFSPSILATPTCASAIFMGATARASSANLSWGTNYPTEPGTTFTLQYRPVTTANWATISSLSATGGTSIFYSLTGLANATTYEWRVQTNCPAGVQAVYSMGPNFTTVCTAPQYPYVMAAATTSADLVWSGNLESNTRFDIRYRPTGITNWTVVNILPAQNGYGGFTHTLTGLTNNTNYDWEVSSACSATDRSAFVAGSSFFTRCQAPESLNSSPRILTATLNWQSRGTGVSYDVRYRKVGTIDWTAVSNITTYSIAIAGLQSSTNYEWQVRSHCDGGDVTDYSSLNTFYTFSCSIPGSLITSEESGTSARLNWYYAYNTPDIRYEIHYRPVGANLWTTVSSLTMTTANGSYVAPGLIPDVQYEWQIRTFCTDTDSSPYSYSILFTTCSQMYSLRAGYWLDASMWSCNRLPNSTDTVQIKHQVLIPYNYTVSAGTLRFDAGQQLIFQSGVKLKLGQ